MNNNNSMQSGMNNKVIGIVIAIVAVLIIAFVMMRQSPGPVTNTPTTNTNTNTNTSTPLVGVYENSTSAQIEALDITAITPTLVRVTGHAVGGWYFEASFPIKIYDQSNNLIGTGIAQAQSDWMTESLVSFIADVNFTSAYSGPATVVLHKDNPSGLPENEASVTYQVTL